MLVVITPHNSRVKKPNNSQIPFFSSPGKIGIERVLFYSASYSRCYQARIFFYSARDTTAVVAQSHIVVNPPSIRKG